MDQTGSFPAEAFRHSAETAYDLSTRMFGCHESGTETPMTCAGFLLRGAQHNMAVRMKYIAGQIDPDAVHDGGHELHDGYVAMAVANGCRPTDEALRKVSVMTDLQELATRAVLRTLPVRPGETNWSAVGWLRQADGGQQAMTEYVDAVRLASGEPVVTLDEEICSLLDDAAEA